MYVRDLSLVVAAIVAATSMAFFQAPVAAQVDCGLECDGCGPFPESYHEGQDGDEWGEYDMECPSFPNESCNECGVTLAAGSVSQEAVGRALVEATVSEAEALMAAHGDRVLLSATRNVVAIQGNACGRHAMGVWVTVSAGKMGALRESGLGGSLEQVLAQRTAVTGVGVMAVHDVP